MSIGNAVFLKRSSMPSPVRWAEAIREQGFAMELDSDFDVSSFSGFLPCAFEGVEAGFEYFYEPVDDADTGLTKKELKRLGDRDIMVTLLTHRDVRGLATSIIASAVLSSISDGIHWNQEANEFSTGDEALSWAREMVKALRPDLEAEMQPKLEEPAPAVREPVAHDATFMAKVIFRGAALMTLEALEEPRRRFNIRIDTEKLAPVTEVQVLGVWERPSGDLFVRKVAIGDITCEFNASGVVQTGGSEVDLVKQIKMLGVTESATRALLGAGEAAVPLLVEAASDAGRSASVRQMAIIILGQIGGGARMAIEPLRALTHHHELGVAARRALELILQYQ